MDIFKKKTYSFLSEYNCITNMAALTAKVVKVPATNAKGGGIRGSIDVLFVSVNSKANLEKVKIRKYGLSKSQEKR